MSQTYTAVIKQAGAWWIEEVPGVNCQERTREELLRITLVEALEGAPCFCRTRVAGREG